MVRSQRLLALIALLRSHRYPVSGQTLADKLEVSVRTLYRDIATLQEQGANIQGEAGVGYVLKPGFLLPPLMFTEEEIEALVLGARWVSQRTDNQLSDGAQNALNKIAAVLPIELKDMLDDTTLLIGPSKEMTTDTVDMGDVRQAIRDEKVLSIDYRDLKGKQSQRRIWPFALGYFDEVRVLVAWCELRQDIRNFRADRIFSCELINTRYATPRHVLLKQWRATLHELKSS
ncbi:helix-turn-helix transcriptional regulator [Marinomonas foliarum]|uniref:Putative DNA-binding transcriptional regulator YafY n=1 Tax=Marinomonas foliarum TaxID=491950 RepID=A0A368ZS03_9GAMM|nr:YafY family protein [Marinomonas foliarum]RCW95472.1 putative DNA-binding transcriptional regulator YafY [Marinomonas foliarum]